MTTPRAAATRHVVERCPSCGVEHDASAGSTCEACDTPLRAWCRQHGRETGWLDGPSCSRCAEDAARAARPKPAPAPRLDVPAPRPDPLFIPDAPGRSLREILEDAPHTEPGTVEARPLGAGLVVFAVIGGLGLLASLGGFFLLLLAEGGAGNLLVLAFAFIFAGSLLALAVVAHAKRNPPGPRDTP